MTVNTWRVARESAEWVGPVTVTATAAGTPVDPGNVQFAVVADNTRPTADDWAAPYVEPGGTALGVWASPVTGYQKLGIWVKITDAPEIPVLEPGEVGWLVRT